MSDLGLERSGTVAVLETCRPPRNYIDEAMVDVIATALEACDQDDAVRAVVLSEAFRSEKDEDDDATTLGAIRHIDRAAHAGRQRVWLAG